MKRYVSTVSLTMHYFRFSKSCFPAENHQSDVAKVVSWHYANAMTSCQSAQMIGKWLNDWEICYETSPSYQSPIPSHFLGHKVTDYEHKTPEITTDSIISNSYGSTKRKSTVARPDLRNDWLCSANGCVGRLSRCVTTSGGIEILPRHVAEPVCRLR